MIGKNLCKLANRTHVSSTEHGDAEEKKESEIHVEVVGVFGRCGLLCRCVQESNIARSVESGQWVLR